MICRFADTDQRNTAFRSKPLSCSIIKNFDTSHFQSLAGNRNHHFICNEDTMSDAHDEHESAIKTPKQLIVAILAGFLVPIIAIVLLVQYVANDKKVGAGSSAQTPEAIAARIHPVADQGLPSKITRP
jgi:hypothetical protein